MKKAALVTFHTPLSFGAQLQAFALQEAIKENHYHCSIINYEPPFSPSSIRVPLTRRFYSDVSSIFFHKRIRLQKSRFSEWRERRFDETKFIASETQLRKIGEDFNVFVCGSDQIWRSPQRGYYFLDFTPDSARRVAYAPSFGNVGFDDHEKEMIRNYLRRFDFLSVRENDGAAFVSQLLGQNIPAVIDPTLLWTSDFWRKYASDPLPKIPKHFVLLFSIQDTIPCFEIAQKVCAKLKLPLVVIDCALRLIWHPFLNNCFDTGPAEFLRLIELADFVVTSSFHGTAFAVIYGKRFLTICRKQIQNVNSRIYSLADILKTKDRVICPGDEIPETIFQEWDPSVTLRLADERRRSWDYLAESLKFA